jgi:hypothetical protein
MMCQEHQRHVVVPARPEAHLIVVQAYFTLAFGEATLNGMITNDKFCVTRACVLPLSWWRCPKSRRQ